MLAQAQTYALVHLGPYVFCLCAVKVGIGDLVDLRVSASILNRFPAAGGGNSSG